MAASSSVRAIRGARIASVLPDAVADATRTFLPDLNRWNRSPLDLAEIAESARRTRCRRSPRDATMPWSLSTTPAFPRARASCVLDTITFSVEHDIQQLEGSPHEPARRRVQVHVVMVFREALDPPSHLMRLDAGRWPRVRACIQLLQSNPQFLRLLDAWPRCFHAPHSADGIHQILNRIVRITNIFTGGRTPECEQDWAPFPQQFIERIQQRTS